MGCGESRGFVPALQPLELPLDGAEEPPEVRNEAERAEVPAHRQHPVGKSRKLRPDQQNLDRAFVRLRRPFISPSLPLDEARSCDLCAKRAVFESKSSSSLGSVPEFLSPNFTVGLAPRASRKAKNGTPVQPSVAVMTALNFQRLFPSSSDETDSSYSGVARPVAKSIQVAASSVDLRSV